MGFTIIKQDRDCDEYVLWSDFTECPVGVGTREEMIPYVEEIESAQGRGGTAARFDRADAKGSSMIPYSHGWWDDEFMIYEQRGLLPRRHIAYAAYLHCDERYADVWDLLEPFEDETEVRRG